MSEDNETVPLVDQNELKQSTKKELAILSSLALPISGSFLVQTIAQACSILIVGRLGTVEIGVAAYSYMVAQSTSTMMGTGASTAIDTLCSQAFTASTVESRVVMGVYLQRAIIILAIGYVGIVLPVWWNGERLFIAMGQEAQLAELSGQFLRMYSMGGLGQNCAECVKKVLQCQGLSHIGTYVNVFAAILSFALNILFIHVLKFGLIGSPIAQTITHWVNFFLLVFFMMRSKEASKCWGGFTRDAFREWTYFLALAVPGILSTATETWSFLTIAIMAGRLGTVAVAAQSIIMTTDVTLCMLPLGLGVAASVRIGNLLGAGKPKYAKFAGRIPLLLAIILGVVEFFPLYFFRNVFGLIFSDDVAVIQLTAEVMPLLAIFQILDLSNGGAAGVLRGTGKQHIAAICNVAAYYGVGISSAYLLGYRFHYGLSGLWMGIVLGSASLALSQLIAVALIRWEYEVQKCRERLQKAVMR